MGVEGVICGEVSIPAGALLRNRFVLPARNERPNNRMKKADEEADLDSVDQYASMNLDLFQEQKKQQAKRTPFVCEILLNIYRV